MTTRPHDSATPDTELPDHDPGPATPSPDESEVPSFEADEEGIDDDALARLAAGASKLFSREDYPGDIGDVSIEKLRDSVVAPLVAQARGYRTLRESTEDARETLKRYELDGRKNPGRHLLALSRQCSWMEIPYFRCDSVARGEPVMASLQLRPERDAARGEGEVSFPKYMFLKQSPTVIDAHPATPEEWFSDASIPMMFTEGVVKSDAALSAMLRDAGVSDEQLRTAVGDRDPIEHLRDLLRRIPEDKRVLILCFPGVSSWKRNDEWNTLAMRGRETWIAFDGDIGRNPSVWDATRGLWDFLENRAERVLLLDLSGDGNPLVDPKRGIDDFLHMDGQWADLMALKRESLPERPESDQVGEKGDTRVSADGRSVEICTVRPDPSGVGEITQWKTIDKIGGYIAAFEESRIPTAVEDEDGKVRPGSVSRSERQVVLHLEWEDEDGVVDTAEIRGPKAMLDEDPRTWESKHKALVPTKVSGLPAWPPRAGLDWTRAVKAYRATERSDDVLFTCQGWVPTSSGNPVFIAGRQVIGADGEGDESAQAGLTADDFPNIESFGVIDEDLTEQEQRDLLVKIVNAYTSPTTFVDPRFGMVALLAGVRPCVPIVPHSILYIVGGRRSGKSWLAASIMQFWQSRGRTWTNERLPGSASDSMAWMENAISRSMMWIADDFAPNSSRQKWERQTSDLEQIVRSSFNRAPRGRMTSDMKTRSSNPPRAFVVITAENELQVDSVRDRMLALYSDTGGGFISNETPNPLDEIEALGQNGDQARLSAQLLRWVARRIRSEGYVAVRDWLLTEGTLVREDMEKVIRDNGGENGRRHAGIASEYALSIVLLKEYAKSIGVPRKLRSRIQDMLSDLALLTLDLSGTQSSRTLGRSVLDALQHGLLSQRGYVESIVPSEIGTKPTQDSNLNAKLGHPEGRDPRGEPIGRFIRNPKNCGRDVVLFYPHAFEFAQRVAPHLIQHGQTADRAWISLWNEGLVAKGLWSRQRHSKTHKPLATVDVTYEGHRVRGIPVFFDVLYAEDVVEDVEDQE